MGMASGSPSKAVSYTHLYYDDVLRASLLDEQQLVSDMEAALESEQFVLYFQPQICYGNGTLTLSLIHI